MVVGIPPLRLQPDEEQIDAPHYLLDELLRYHDRMFIAHVYTALAKREPTNAELANAVDDLRSGRRGKVEIIEGLLAARANGEQKVDVEGLPSPVLRRLSRWPVIGYVLRFVHGLARLPLLMRDQQHFETYAMGQQQLIADYLNDQLLPAIGDATSTPNSPQDSTVADAIEGVMMLSDSLQELQKQREESETLLHADLVRLTEALTAQQQQIGELREFLVQEQRLIVETQKVVLGDMQEHLGALIQEQEGKQAELASEVRRLRTQIESLRTGAREPLVAQEREQA